MKAILISIKPKYVADILNGNKTLEIRKTIPKCDLPIDVYIYCTKGKPNLWLPYEYDCFELDEASQPYLSDKPILDIDTKLNGKVVGYFTLNKVSRTYEFYEQELLDKACLSDNELFAYLKHDEGYAWHIDNLVVFDKPKEISEFVIDRKIYKQQLYRAPQSWFYVEI